MFSPKYLIGFLGITGVASGITASAFLSKKKDNNEEKRNIVEVVQEKPKAFPTISQIPDVKEDAPKSNFSGKLVFSRDNKKDGFSRSGEVFYEGKIFDNKDYQEKTDEEDTEKYITVDISLEKSKDEIEIKLKDLNEKIKDKFKDRLIQGTTLNIFEEVLKNLEEEFKKIFNGDIYKKLLEIIKDLKEQKSKV